MDRSSSLAWLLVLFISPAKVFTQEVYKGVVNLERREVKNTTTYVQLTGDKIYDERIQNVLKEGWSLSRNIVFVGPEEESPDARDPHNTYLTFYTLSQASPGMGGSSLMERSLAFCQGLETLRSPHLSSAGPMQMSRSMIMGTPMDIHGRERQAHQIAWRLPLVIKGMEQMLKFVYDTREGVGTKPLTPEKVVKGRAGAIRRKTLLVWDDRFNEDELEAIKTNYAHPVEVVSQAAIMKAIDSRDERYAILVFAAGLHHQVLVHDAATHEMLYARQKKFGMYLTEGDVKALSKAVEKEQ